MKKLLLLSILGSVLVGCDSAKTALGINKTTPDEFTVITRAPLTLPPNYTLRPPQPGQARPQELTSYQQAQRVLQGQQNQQQNKLALRGGPAEQRFLRQAGATGTTGNIRQIVDSEAVDGQSFKDVLLQKQTADTQTINAVKERQRITEQGINSDNAVASQTVEPKPWWKRIF